MSTAADQVATLRKPFYQEILCQDVLEGTYLSSLLANTLKSNQVEIGSAGTGRVARLKEPRDPCTLPREPDCAHEAARWPVECQVVEGRIQHIDASPIIPENYYDPTGKEIQPKPIGDEHGTVLFQYHPMSAVTYNSDDEMAPKIIALPKRAPDFSRATARGARAGVAGPGAGDSLGFESRFESGNLAKAVRITDTYYELSLRTDLYTNRHVQWFYFMVENTRTDVTYRFSIVNLSKGESLYNEGMRPVMYSTKDAVLNKLGWSRCGTNIAYYRNDSPNGEDDQNCSFTLSFNIEFPHEDDCVFLAHCYPYTYTDLQEYLLKLQNHPIKSSYSKLRLLCKTLAGNNVYYLTVTEPSNLDDQPKKKKAVVVTARVHPGETPASWMMKGLMDYITGDTDQAKELREKFIFKLVPMLNPDGVIVGNNRCSLTGRDLNRQYRTVIRETYPPVWHTKLMIKRLLDECGIAIYCDLHAHSRKHNVFIYGCENKRTPDKKLQEQVFPLMLHKNTADKFSFESCKFRIQRNKEGTGRVVTWMMGVANSYTLEASFAGSTLGRRTRTHFSTADYESIGRSFCETLLDFVDDAPSKEILGEIETQNYFEAAKRRVKRRRAHKHKHKRLHKDGSPKLFKQLQIIQHSPPRQRKTIQIGKAIVEFEKSSSSSSSDSEGETSRETEPFHEQPQPIIPAIHASLPPIAVPPELVVTQKVGSDRRFMPERSKSADFQKVHFYMEERSPTKTKFISPVRATNFGGEGDGRQNRLQTLLIAADNEYSVTLGHRSDQQEKILRSCSRKLSEYVRRQKVKKEKKTKEEKDAALVNKRRLKLKTRSNKIDQTTGGEGNEMKNEALRIKSFKTTDGRGVEKSSMEKKRATGQAATKKFRKGGFVVTAAVHPKISKGDGETIDVTEGAPKKKKKKKKKLHLIQSTVKSVFAVVARADKRQ